LRTTSLPGLYLYRLSATENGNQGIASCRIASNVLVIHVYPRPAFTAGPDRVILAGSQAMLIATAADSNLVYSWSPTDNLDNTTGLNPVASPATDKLYSLTAVSLAGCTATDQVLVRVIAGIFVPTAFTPNNDGKNDRWRIPFLDPVWGATVSVYNRYGQQVYKVSGAMVDWDGKLNGQPQPTGVYVYQVRFRDSTPEQCGTFSLIR
jgi:gliding motility-associated-like protein